MSIKKLVKEYFSYSTSEKRGILVLLVLLVLAYLLPHVIEEPEPSKELVSQGRQKQIDSLLAVIETNDQQQKQKPRFPRVTYQMSEFDPNTASKEKLCSLGFKPFQADNIIKYRKKGGSFRTKADLSKIYGISEKDMSRVFSYIKIATIRKPKKKTNLAKTKPEYFQFDPNTINNEAWQKLGVHPRIYQRIGKYLATGARFRKPKDLAKIYGFDSLQLLQLLPYIKIKQPTSTNKKKETLIVDVNKADTSQLKKLPGIGSVLSKRIIKYRDILGGYASKEQLLEVYGISQEKFQHLSHCVTVDSVVVKKLNINSLGFKTLSKHPYLTLRMSQDIVRFRQKNGNFHSVNQLKHHHIISDSIFKKLAPYLKIAKDVN